MCACRSYFCCRDSCGLTFGCPCSLLRRAHALLLHPGRALPRSRCVFCSLATTSQTLYNSSDKALRSGFVSLQPLSTVEAPSVWLRFPAAESYVTRSSCRSVSFAAVSFLVEIPGAHSPSPMSKCPGTPSGAMLAALTTEEALFHCRAAASQRSLTLVTHDAQSFLQPGLSSCRSGSPFRLSLFRTPSRSPLLPLPSCSSGFVLVCLEFPLAPHESLAL